MVYYVYSEKVMEMLAGMGHTAILLNPFEEAEGFPHAGDPVTFLSNDYPEIIDLDDADYEIIE